MQATTLLFFCLRMHKASGTRRTQAASRLAVFFSLLLIGGCSSTPAGEDPHHRGPKINLSHFVKNTATYKGKAITLDVVIDEAIPQGQSLQNYVGRDVKVAALGPKGEREPFVITIPQGLAVPDVGHADEVSVTFVCTRGSLRQGNEARLVERR
jgi:hypothetical protein